jgi:hypothetical protein
VHIWAHEHRQRPPTHQSWHLHDGAGAAPGWDDPWIDPSSGSAKPRSKARKHRSGVAHLTEVSTSRERKTRHRSPARMRSRLPSASRPLSGRRDWTTTRGAQRTEKPDRCRSRRTPANNYCACRRDRPRSYERRGRAGTSVRYY